MNYTYHFNARPPQNFARRNPYLTPGVKGILIANLIVFAVQFICYLLPKETLAYGYFMYFFALHPEMVVHKYYVWQLLTAGFMHDIHSIAHIFFNMLTLYFFGHLIEDLYGTRKFIKYYLFAIVFSSTVYMLFSIDYEVLLGYKEIPYDANFGYSYFFLQNSMIGASGAIMAILVTSAWLYPNAVVFLYFLFPIKLRTLIYLLIGVDLFSALTNTQNQIAVMAHLGGALFGFLYFKKDAFVTQFRKLKKICSIKFPKIFYFFSPKDRYKIWKEKLEEQYNVNKQQEYSFQNNTMYPNDQEYSFQNTSFNEDKRKSEPRKIFTFQNTTESVSSTYSFKNNNEKEQDTSHEIEKILEKIKNQGICSLTEREREILLHTSKNHKNKYN
ncbi:MAG TPA: rhomboid family intramembrane serine protease [Planctomycetota bacterium]|nr:rhomboid family intramembrane serine protease [Planctomycetota bacterium]HPY75523.1 rhomboid family intramembrane serine protease [Planctomycetota bacterium]HQB01136.1 rhomboid family intramembrane serine protease [Planctomycetota bacterium]